MSLSGSPAVVRSPHFWTASLLLRAQVRDQFRAMVEQAGWPLRCRKTGTELETYGISLQGNTDSNTISLALVNPRHEPVRATNCPACAIGLSWRL